MDVCKCNRVSVVGWLLWHQVLFAKCLPSILLGHRTTADFLRARINSQNLVARDRARARGRHRDRARARDRELEIELGTEIEVEIETEIEIEIKLETETV